MREMIACCGLDCEKCGARIATLTNDVELLESTAKIWAELNKTEITADMVRCLGCRTEGIKTPFCEGMCVIRMCARAKGYETCGECALIESCDKVALVIGNNDAARANLLG